MSDTPVAEKATWNVHITLDKFDGDFTAEQIDAGQAADALIETLERDGNLLMYGGVSCLWQALIGNGTSDRRPVADVLQQRAGRDRRRRQHDGRRRDADRSAGVDEQAARRDGRQLPVAHRRHDLGRRDDHVPLDVQTRRRPTGRGRSGACSTPRRPRRAGC
jgi:hypothetical protein